MTAPPDTGRLRADCANCFGLCCVAPAFAASADFAIDKAAGQPCPHLQEDFGCGIHSRLRQQGFPGCAVYDCFGAGQHVAQVTFGGLNWRRAPQSAPQMFEVFGIMRQLHELLWYLAEALTLVVAQPLHDQLDVSYDEIERLTELGPVALTELDVTAHRDNVGALLRRTSDIVRARLTTGGQKLSGADLIGANLKRTDMRGADLRAALLIGADLRAADLRGADFLGADLRGADLRGADLTGSIFLTHSQLQAAKGDVTTTLPGALTRPVHWQAAPS